MNVGEVWKADVGSKRFLVVIEGTQTDTVVVRADEGFDTPETVDAVRARALFKSQVPLVAGGLIGAISTNPETVRRRGIDDDETTFYIRVSDLVGGEPHAGSLLEAEALTYLPENPPDLTFPERSDGFKPSV